MKRNLLCLILLLCGCLSAAWGDDLNLNSRRISVQDGLLGNTVNELVQDGQGYIWMATNNGLSRYDGYSTLNYASFSYATQQHMEARIGRITYDPSGLLWLSTATYVNACYELKKGCFADWTGCNDAQRALNKFMLSSSRGMFFYGYSFGVRRSRYVDGRFLLTDYNAGQGQLPSDEVLMLLEDRHGNIWMPTDKGVALLSVEETLRTLLPGKHIIAASTHDDHTYFLTAAGEAFVFDHRGQQIGTSQLSGTLGPIGKVNTSFIWQGQWMVFTQGDTYSMNVTSGAWKVERGERNVVDGLNQGTCKGYRFIANRSGRLWVFPDEGPLRTFDLLTNAHFTVNRGRKFHIIDDNEGRLFIATYGNGLFVWNPSTDQLRHYTAEQSNPIIRSNFLLYAIRDHQGNIWLGSEATGAYCLTIMTGKSVVAGAVTKNYVLPEPAHQGDWANAVSCVTERADSSIAIGTREGGVYRYDTATGDIQKVMASKANVTSVFFDDSHRMWVCTNGAGLYLDGQQYCREDSIHFLPENKLSDICQDVRGRIWIASRDGGLLMTQGQDGGVWKFRQLMNRQMNESRIHVLELLPDGILWIGTNNGIYRLDTRQQNIDEQSFQQYNTTNGLFPYDEIFTLHYTATDSLLWVGAAGSGVMKCRFAADGSLLYTERITTAQGLGNDNVYSIVEDPYGYVWAGTEDGISRIHPQNNIVNTYRPSPVLQGNVATENCACLTRGGLLLFGTNYGLVTIRPSTADRETGLLPTRITDLRAAGTSIYDQLTTSSGLSLPHDRNSLSFCFSNFNYDHTQTSLYQFYLQGVEKTWRPMTTENHADYSLLPPGNYVFHVRSLGSNNEWQEETTLSFRIRQPWYNTWWAWAVYVLLIMLFLLYVYRNWKDKFDLKQQMKLQQQLSEFRMQLFTNVTHEFRTPLAVIKGAVDKLDGDRTAVKTARRGVERMLKLVNQFMEFRKVRTGNLQLRVAQGDIVAFVREIVQDFWPMAQQKEIQVSFLPSMKSLVLPFDRQIVETILYNLLSNAVKYTPEKGTVLLRLKEEGQLLRLTCEDSGTGISPQRQEAMFRPFMQGLASQGGMGIGLYTAYEMAKAHHGLLSYERSQELGGSMFVVQLPFTDGPYQAEDYSQEENGSNGREERSEADMLIRELQPEALNDVTIAVIEDDPDMMEQLRSELGVYFHIDSYMNGQAGFEGVVKKRPSLLVCDVMLPDMDGYEIVNRLRKTPETALLPVIMLTALGDEAHQIRAYKAGADDYMVKPCNFRLLVARAMQLLKWRETQTANTETVKTTTASIGNEQPAGGETLFSSQADKVFCDKLTLFVAQHMSEADFNVDRLSEMMAMGRTKFYGKVKELTGMSPNKYLMQQRMQKAADLLADGELNVAEVSYRVGIQDPSYFNKCFKAQFGVAPSKYVQPAKD